LSFGAFGFTVFADAALDAALGFVAFTAALFEAELLDSGLFKFEAFGAGVLRVDVLPVFGRTDLDNTDVVRDHSFHCIANAESRHALILGI
jgi:hypothetical protein